MKIDRNDLWAGCRFGAWLGAATAALVLLPASMGRMAPGPPMAAAPAVAMPSAPHRRRAAVFGAEAPTADVRWLADWIADSRDNGGAGFILVDKRAAQLHVFDVDARWVASSAVLLGAALGDESAPGIGSRPLAAIRTSERTTPAGRFVGERGRNASGEDIVWVDYEAAVSLHRVRLTHPRERRAERLASPSVADNRITYGCINLPVAFYEQHIQPIFVRQQAVIYVLPDMLPAQQVFGPQPAILPRDDGSLRLVADRAAGSDPAFQHVSSHGAHRALRATLTARQQALAGSSH